MKPGWVSNLIEARRLLNTLGAGSNDAATELHTLKRLNVDTSSYADWLEYVGRINETLGRR